MNWERGWIIVAVLLLTAAAFFLWRNNLPAAFVTAALGSCAWFLSYRAQLRASGDDESENLPGEESDEE
jgi:hypothetical protein